MSELLEQLEAEPTPTTQGVKVIEDIGIEEDLDDHHEQLRAEAIQAAPFEWHGRKLAAFAIGRESDWLIYRAKLNYPDFMQCIESDNSMGFLNDALAIVWFCLHDPSEWIGLRFEVLNLKIKKWADSNVQAHEIFAIIQLAHRIYQRAHATMAEPRPSAEGGSSEKK